MKKMIALLLSLFAIQTALAELPIVTEKLDLEAAKNFAVDRLEGGYSLITVQNGGRFLLIPAGMDAPDGLDADIMLLYMPLDNLFVASTSTVALMDEIGALSAVTQTTYDVEDWYLPSVKQAVQDGQIAYIGHYKQPDFERIALNPPKLAVFSTMIEGTPDVREKLDELGIPLLVDSSALEETPLGRMEWMKLYGVLLGRENEASTAFDAQKQKIESLEPMQENVTVAMFYITSKGALYVRNNGDYMVKMLELAGGRCGLHPLYGSARRQAEDTFAADLAKHAAGRFQSGAKWTRLLHRRRLFSAGRTAGRPHRGYEPHAFG